MESLDLADLALSWQTHLEAERKAANTVRLYLLGVRGFLRWCDQEGGPAVLDRPRYSAHVAALLRAGAEPATRPVPKMLRLAFVIQNDWQPGLWRASDLRNLDEGPGRRRFMSSALIRGG